MRARASADSRRLHDSILSRWFLTRQTTAVPPGIRRMHVERRVDDAGAVLHDPQSHPAVPAGVLRNSDSVILDGDAQRAVERLGTHDDLPRPGVLYRVVDRLLHDPEEMRRQHVVVDLDGLPAFDPAIDAAAGLRLGGQFFQGHHEARGVDFDGDQPLTALRTSRSARWMPVAIVWAVSAWGLSAAASFWARLLAR